MSRLTARSLEVLRNIARGYDITHGVHGQSAFGGLEHTRYALQRRRLIEFDAQGKRWAVTDLGRAAAETGKMPPVCLYHPERLAVMRVLHGATMIDVCDEDLALYRAVDVHDPESNVRVKREEAL